MCKCYLCRNYIENNNGYKCKYLGEIKNNFAGYQPLPERYIYICNTCVKKIKTQYPPNCESRVHKPKNSDLLRK